jgi:hypothetical protein
MANYRKSFNFRNGVQVDNDNFIVNANGLVGIGTSIPTEFLDVRGTAKVSGIVSTADLFVTEDVFVSGASTVTVLDATSLNATGVVTAQQFIGDGSLLSGVVAVARTGWTITTAGISTLINVGVGTTNPATLLQVGGDPTSATFGVGIDSTGQGNFTGIVTAGSFQSTGIITGSSILASGFSTFFSSVQITNDLNVSGVATATTFIGDLTGEINAAKFDTNSTGIVVSGIATFTDDAQITAGGLTVTGVTTSTSFDGNITGDVTGNVVGNITGDVIGDITGEVNAAKFDTNSTGIVVSGIATFTDDAQITAGGLTVTGVTTSTSFVGNITGDVTGDVTGDITGDVTGNVTGYLSGVAQTAGFAGTSFALAGIPEITVGNIVGSSATVTALVVDNKLGIGSDTPASDIEIRKITNAAIDVITSSNTSRISVGQSVGTGNSSGVLSFNSGTLSLSNYDFGGVNINLHSGSGAGTTESFKVRYDDNTKFETTYDGKVGVNRHGITLTRELEVGGNTFISGYGQVAGILTVGQGANQLTLGDGSALPISSSAVISVTSGISTFNDLLVSRNFQVGSGIGTFLGNTFVGGKLGIGTASETGFPSGGGFESTIFGDMYATEGFIAKTRLGVSTAADGGLQQDPRSIPSALGQIVPQIAYGDFQADSNGFTMFGGVGLFVPSVGVQTTGYGTTNLGMVPNDADSKKYLMRVGFNTYFARSILDVGAASTTMNSYIITPSVNNEELDIIANLWSSNAGGNQNVNPVQSGFGTATAKKLLAPNGVPGGSIVYNNESRRLNVSTGGTVFCGVATLTQNQSGYDSLAIPTFNSTKRNLMSGYGNLPKGAIMYNTTTNKLNFWNGSAWEAVTSST